MRTAWTGHDLIVNSHATLIQVLLQAVDQADNRRYADVDESIELAKELITQIRSIKGEEIAKASQRYSNEV